MANCLPSKRYGHHGRYFFGKGYPQKISSFFTRACETAGGLQDLPLRGGTGTEAQKFCGVRTATAGKTETFERHRTGGHEGEKKGLKIDSSVVGMESARSYRASNTTFTRFSLRDYQEGMGQGRNALNTEIGNDGQGTGQTTGQSLQRDRLEELQGRLQRFGIRVQVRNAPSQAFESIRNQTVNYILDLFFGRWSGSGRLSLYDMGSAQASYQIDYTAAQPASTQEWTLSQGNLLYEAEDTSFSTTGTVRTSDGREINFNVNVGMSRQFQQYYEQELQPNLNLVDPLVINLDGDVADISDQTFFFDLDGDGTLDEVNQLGSGSGFLALDKNGDGTINDGSELFGTSSGNGFRDLAQYDEDGNGWIDENDAIWSKLKIWCKDANGNDVLYRLADKGVGAICLQNVGTQFTQQGQDGSTKGVIRNTGVFLYENGNVGTVQHVDMARRSYSA